MQVGVAIAAPVCSVFTLVHRPNAPVVVRCLGSYLGQTVAAKQLVALSTQQRNAKADALAELVREVSSCVVCLSRRVQLDVAQ